MANILTAQEASIVLRCEIDDPAMLESLPLVDAHLKQATGRDWSVAIEGSIEPVAKSAARMLLVIWHENPGMFGTETPISQFGLPAIITQLKARDAELKELGS
jgi:hypothetical protein